MDPNLFHLVSSPVTIFQNNGSVLPVLEQFLGQCENPVELVVVHKLKICVSLKNIHFSDGHP